MAEQNLSTASRETLLAVIAEQATRLVQQEATIAELQKRLTALEARLTKRGGPGMPGNKPASARPPEAPKPRKRRGRGFGRARLTPTETVTHAVESCPDCGTRLVGGWVQRTREVIEVPVQPVRVIAHQYLARECPVCRKRQTPRVALGGVVLGPRCRVGVGLASLVTTLREEGRLPFPTIQWVLGTLYQAHLSQGELVAIIRRVATEAAPAVEGIRMTMRQGAVVHADETGWREHGVNGYVWTFSTPTERYFVRRGRHKEVVDEVLGPDFTGTLVSDFYAAYDHYAGVHQRCWPHLLRDIHDLKTVYPADESLANWAAAVVALYHEAAAFASPEARVRRAKQDELELRLLAVCQPFLTDPVAVQRKLCRRIAKYLTELFVFVGNPVVPATNNAAERSLRHLVTSRKISGGTQSGAGTTSKMILSSLFGTWRAQGHDPLIACRSLLQSPHH